VLDQELRCAETLFVLKVVRYDRLACPKRKPSRGSKVCANAGPTDDTLWPADTGAHEKSLLVRKMLHHLGIVGLQAFCDQLSGLVQEFFECCVLKRQHPELGEDLLLPDAFGKRAPGRSISFRIRLHYRMLFLLRHAALLDPSL